jgi:hypothetical protein
MEGRLRPGHHVTLESRSPDKPLMAVFEDDGETGYFYAVDLSREHGSKIVDAVQIYVAKEEYGEVEESLVQVMWSPDGCKAALVLDGEAQAAFDFSEQIGCSLSGFPPANEGWKRLRGRSPAEISDFFAGHS